MAMDCSLNCKNVSVSDLVGALSASEPASLQRQDDLNSEAPGSERNFLLPFAHAVQASRPIMAADWRLMIDYRVTA